MGEQKVLVHKEESILVSGSIIHSIWNETDAPLKMIGITIQPEK